MSFKMVSCNRNIASFSMNQLTPSVLLLFLLSGLVAFSLFYAWLSLAPWVPSNLSDRKRIHDIADLKSGQIFFEMGCGNGRVCSYIARKNPSAKVIGIELAFLFYVFTKIRTFLFGPKNLKIIFGDALKYDISDVDVLYVYGLTDSVNNKIKQKIEAEMKPGAKFISYVFPIKEWGGKQTVYKPHSKEFAIHVYEK